jgi:hypothetical protein
MFINANLIIYKLYCLTQNETRKNFIDSVVGNVEINNNNFSVTKKIMERINKIMGFKYGVKPLYINKQKDMYLFKSQVLKIEDENKNEVYYYDGYFCKVNLNNAWGTKFKKQDQFKKFTLENIKECVECNDKNFKDLSFKYLYDLAQKEV